MAAMIYINGKPFPYPARGAEFIVSTFVSSGRNANGAMVGQVVGRDNYKISNLLWPYLDAETWSSMLKEFDKKKDNNDRFFVIARIPDMVNNDWITVKMYPGDRSAKPQWINKESGLPTHYIDCKVNLIDCGEVT